MTQETIKTVLYLPGQLWYSLVLVNRDFSKNDFISPDNGRNIYSGVLVVWEMS